MFTEFDVLRAAFEQNDFKPICTDMLDYALTKPTLDDAVETILVDTVYWDGTGVSNE